MRSEADVKHWQRLHQRSVSAVCITTAFTLALGGVLWVLNQWLRIPTWFVGTVIGICIASILGDVINILHLRRRLRRMRSAIGRFSSR